MKIFRTSKALSLLAIVTLALSGCTSAAVGDLTTPADATVVDLSSESAPAASDRSAIPTVAPTPATATPSASPEGSKWPSSTEQTRGPSASASQQSATHVGAALEGLKATTVLSQLPVKGKAPMTGYDRNDKFGNGWKDPDGNKCDARQDILTRDMTNVVYKDSRQCTVASGTLNDLYTGKSINWKVKAGSVDIDHAVALGNVWISGGQQLSQDQRVAVANDPLNLIASDASANRAKGDKNAAEWLPPNKAFRCQYVATQISVKHKYALSVTAPEKAAMAKVLDTCPAQPAAEVTLIKPSGQSKAKTKAPAEEKKVDTSAKEPATTQLVHPGAFCSDAGATGTGKRMASHTPARPLTPKIGYAGGLRKLEIGA